MNTTKYQGLVACIKAQEQEHKKCESVLLFE